jgi:membrane associated rhomboid family serine protease
MTTAFSNPYGSHIHDDDDEDDSYRGGYEPAPRRRNRDPGTPESVKSRFSLLNTTAHAIVERIGSPFSRASRRSQWDDYDSGEEWSGGEEEGRDDVNSTPSSPPRVQNTSRVRSLRPTSRRTFLVKSSRKSSTKTEQPPTATLAVSTATAAQSAGFIDPWESPEPKRRRNSQQRISQDEGDDTEQYALSPRHADDTVEARIGAPANATFLEPSDIHPNMISREDDVAQLRLLAGKLSADWKGQDFMAPALARRIRDFQFAQDKRRRKYGNERPWGILGLYDHLASIRIDVEWAEDAAWRRANGEPYLSWTDFDASKKTGINRPFFTYFLLFVCSAALIATFAVNGWTVEPLDINPMIGPSAETLIRMGAKDSYLIVVDNQAWRLVSSTILHAGLVHFFINMLALWFIGSAIETCHGSIAAAILFIIPAVGGTVLSALFLPEYITVGASGGIFGYVGACLSDIVMNWKLLFCDFVTENGKKHHHVVVLVILVLDIALNCVIGLTPYVDNFTHLGGMVFGFLCGLSTMERLSSDFFGMEQSCCMKTKQIIVRFFGVIVSVIGILIATIILMEGDGQYTPCPSCTWLSCVPFPPWQGAANKWWYCDDCERVTANIIQEPNLHLELICPDGTSVAVGIETEFSAIDRNQLIKELPSYCREYCANT